MNTDIKPALCPNCVDFDGDWDFLPTADDPQVVETEETCLTCGFKFHEDPDWLAAEDDPEWDNLDLDLI